MAVPTDGRLKLAADLQERGVLIAGGPYRLRAVTHLDVDDDGIDRAVAALRAIVAAAPGHLLPEGWLLLEHGATQGGAVRDLLVARGFRHVGSLPDLAGHERVTEGQWPAQPAPGSNLAHRNHHAPL